MSKEKEIHSPPKKLPLLLIGLFTGVLNGLFGAGGGMIAVTFLKKAGLDAKKAHATSIAIVLPLAVLSSCLYLGGGHFKFRDSLIFLPAGLVGALAGAAALPKLSNKWLRRGFAALILFFAVRLFLR